MQNNSGSCGEVVEQSLLKWGREQRWGQRAVENNIILEKALRGAI